MMRMMAGSISSFASGAASIQTPSARELGPSLDLKPRTSSGVGLLDDHDVNILIGITSMLLVLCIIAVGGRLLARRISKVQLEADDYLVVIALVNSSPILWILPFMLICPSSVSSYCTLYRTIYAYERHSYPRKDKIGSLISTIVAAFGKEFSQAKVKSMTQVGLKEYSAYSRFRKFG